MMILLDVGYLEQIFLKVLKTYLAKMTTKVYNNPRNLQVDDARNAKSTLFFCVKGYFSWRKLK